jgi:hypothetical protein
MIFPQFIETAIGLHKGLQIGDNDTILTIFYSLCQII